MSENERKKRDFIEEQIRKKPFYRKKGFVKTVSFLGLSVVFGAAAGLAFGVVKPWAENQFGEPAKLVMVHDEEEQGSVPGIVESVEAAARETKETEERVQKETQEGALAEYQTLYEQMSAVTEEMSNALVTVHGTVEQQGWFDEIAETKSQSTGLIVAMNNYNVYILTDKNITNGDKTVKVTLPGGSIVDAVLQGEDRITRMAIVKIPYGRIGEQTLKQLKAAVFDDMDDCKIGEPVIALGVDFMSFGTITSLPKMTICDGTYQKITTNIIGDGDNGGVLLNLKGQVIGLLGVVEDIQDLDLLEGLGIEDSHFLVESLSNREVMPYLGITGKEITENISEALSMPRGIFIKEVASYSPAMKMGIQEADILTKMNGREIFCMADYMGIMETLEPGDTVTLELQRQDSGRYKKIEVIVTLNQR